MRIPRALEAMLAELAAPLMQAGITPRLFGDLAARAFVKAACRASTFRNGKINQSRVAVLTGLSRPEVRRVMRGPRSITSRFQPRTERAVHGWTSDPRYAAPSGTPRSLPVTGSKTSFASLVKQYAGDVPHHAVLEELRRLKLVKEDRQHVQLVTPAPPTSRTLEKSLSLLLALVSDGVALSAATRGSRAPKGMHRLILKATNARDSIALYERALTSAASFVSGLDQSLQPASTRQSKKRGSRVTVSVLVRLKEPRARPDSKTRRHRNVPSD